MTVILPLLGVLHSEGVEWQKHESRPYISYKASGLYVVAPDGDVSRIENLDAKTGQVLYRNGFTTAYLKDKDKVCTYQFKGNKYNPSLVDTLKWADLATFKVADPYFAFDKNHIYDSHKTKFPYDLATLDINRYPDGESYTDHLFFLMDKNIVVVKGRKQLEWADPATFKVINSNYCKDKNHVRYLSFWWGGCDVKKIDWIDAGTTDRMDLMDFPTGRDTTTNELIDAKLYNIWMQRETDWLNSGMITDGKDVWIYGIKVNVSDVATFVSFDWDPLYKYEDKNFYYDGKFKKYPKNK